MKLYTHPGSCSTSAHISLLEAGLAFDPVVVDLGGDRKLPDGRMLVDINPKGYVPVLELDDGTILTEVVAILIYIGDLNPGTQLIPPAGTIERLRLIEWLAFIGSEIHKTFFAFRLVSSSEENTKVVKDRFAARFSYVDGVLAENTYLNGDTFTVADAYLITMLDGALIYNLDLSPYRHIARYMELLGQKESIQKARESVKEFLNRGNPD